MKLGFTGTQQGMNVTQQHKVETILTFNGCCEVHHGDCIGADAQFHLLALHLGHSIILHPSNITSRRAYSTGETTHLSPKPPLVRNHDIVDAVDIMIAAPKESHEVLRSGTWATIRYCRKVGKIIHVIYP